MTERATAAGQPLTPPVSPRLSPPVSEWLSPPVLGHLVQVQPESRRFASARITSIAALALGSALLIPTHSSRPPLVAAPTAVSSASVAGTVTARPLMARASRGVARPTLPVRPVQFVTRLVAFGPSFSGAASWYGKGFEGRRTASGERFHGSQLTAASRTLPFGTLLRVCLASRSASADPSSCVVVRINDRGPYVGHRILDLSAAAHRALGMGGVARVVATPVAYVRVPLSEPLLVRVPRVSSYRPVSHPGRVGMA